MFEFILIFHKIGFIQEEDEETIVARRRLERLKRLAKVKEQKALEEEQAAKVKAQEEAEEARARAEKEAQEKEAQEQQEKEAQEQEKAAGQNAPIWPPPPPPLQHSEANHSVAFDLGKAEEAKAEGFNGGEPVQQVLLEKLEQEANEEYLKQPKRPVVVTMDAEVLVLINGRSCITQLGAFAWTSYPSFQPLSFFTYLLSDLVRDREALTPASKLTLMDTLRLKTSNFDVTRSGEKQVVYRHPEKGKVGAVEEAEGLQAFISYLSSLGGPVTLVVHSKDAVLPVLLGLLNEHKIQAEFSKTVTHVCDLVSLAWGFRLDRLWLGSSSFPISCISFLFSKASTTPPCAMCQLPWCPTSPLRMESCLRTGLQLLCGLSWRGWVAATFQGFLTFCFR